MSNAYSSTDAYSSTEKDHYPYEGDEGTNRGFAIITISARNTFPG